ETAEGGDLALHTAAVPRNDCWFASLRGSHEIRRREGEGCILSRYLRAVGVLRVLIILDMIMAISGSPVSVQLSCVAVAVGSTVAVIVSGLTEFDRESELSVASCIEASVANRSHSGRSGLSEVWLGEGRTESHTLLASHTPPPVGFPVTRGLP